MPNGIPRSDFPAAKRPGAEPLAAWMFQRLNYRSFIAWGPRPTDWVLGIVTDLPIVQTTVVFCWVQPCFVGGQCFLSTIRPWSHKVGGTRQRSTAVSSEDADSLELIALATRGTWSLERQTITCARVHGIFPLIYSRSLARCLNNLLHGESVSVSKQRRGVVAVILKQGRFLMIRRSALVSALGRFVFQAVASRMVRPSAERWCGSLLRN